MHTPSTAYTEYSIHQDQYTPSSAHTKYSTHQVQQIWSTVYTQHRLSSLHSHGQKLTPECSSSSQLGPVQIFQVNNIQVNPIGVLFQFCSMMASHVFVHTHVIMSSNYDSKFTPSWPESTSPNSVNLRHQAHLWDHTFNHSRCISE